jgi:hypothetical protein
MTPEKLIDERIKAFEKQGLEIIVGGDANPEENALELDILYKAKRCAKAEAKAKALYDLIIGGSRSTFQMKAKAKDIWNG